ncbi:LLM class F420-dependent oxidoreductase [Enemella dayhoffiae]|uniref:LLM class F420-dependent oxidoreductase n=1 Tax=Enemella dayhoffiae TaxID=2016507 RepID=A0A255GS55_9ACTN|nr:TIGR03560 family F420-dependent LLM class oxidoreductase [Enemella dayhoffiae]OYO18649.1 LLM class F420-dependent oxidoreductase [Enemella dayhoffiae]
MTEYAVKTPPQHGSWADYLDVWRTADQIDTFTHAWVFDHFYPLVGDRVGTCLESWTMLSALAQATSRIRIGSMVNGMHYRHPAVTAAAAGTLDIISGGRFALGLGAGWFEPESEAYGIELGTISERMDRFDEGVEVIVSLLSNDTTTFAGKYYRLTDARCEPKGVQRPHPPIVIGGTGRKRTMRTAARYAQQWDALFLDSPEAFTEVNEVMNSHCADIGRDPVEITRSVHLAWADGADPGQLAEEAAGYAAAGADQIVFSMRGPYRAASLEPLANALIANRG